MPKGIVTFKLGDPNTMWRFINAFYTSAQILHTEDGTGATVRREVLRAAPNLYELKITQSDTD